MLSVPPPSRATTLPAPPPKACGCGREHDAVDWSRLRLVGYMDDGEGGRIELRDCVCKSTLAIEVPS